MNDKRYTVELVKDGDDVILPFPDELMEEMGWKEGDEISFEDLGDGSFSITKIDSK